MEYWTSKFEEIGADRKVRALQTLLMQTDGVEFTDEQREILPGLIRALQTIRARLIATDPQLVTEATLNSIAQVSEQKRAQFEEFKTSHDANQFNDVRLGVEEMLRTSASGGLIALDEQSVTTIRGAANRFRDNLRRRSREFEATVRTLSERQVQLQEKADEFSVRVAELESDLNSVRDSAGQVASATREAIEATASKVEGRLQEILTAGDDALAQATEALALVTTQVKEVEADQRARFDDAFNGLEARFADSEVSRETRFGDEQKERQQSATNVLQSIREKAADLQTATEEEVSELLQQIGKLKQEATETLGLAASASTFEAYSREADAQKQEADTWRKASVGALLVALLAAVWSLAANDIPDQVGLWEFFATYSPRTALLAISIGLATYAARQSGSHRRREEDARRLANELKTFHPFIGTLPPGEQARLRALMTERLFRGQDARVDAVRGAELRDSELGKAAEDLLKVATSPTSNGAP